MKLRIDNLDGLGARDYSVAVEPGTLEIARVLNKPSTLSAAVCLPGSGLPVPVRRARVSALSEAGALLFTGYLVTEPAAVYTGEAGEGTVYRLGLRAVSEEWLLDKAGVLARAGLTIGVQGGAALGALARRLLAGAGGLTPSAGGGRQLGVYEVPAAVPWSAGAESLAGAAYGAYRVLNGAMSVRTAGSVTHTLADGDGALVVSSVRTAEGRELANDVTLTGEMEPAAYWTELFEGDGTTASFALTGQPESLTAGAAKLLSDDFSQPSLDRQVWSAADPGSHLGLSGSGLTLSGGNGLDGQTTLTALDPVELGGTLVLELDEVQLKAPSAGVIGGFLQRLRGAGELFCRLHRFAGRRQHAAFADGERRGRGNDLHAGQRAHLRLAHSSALPGNAPGEAELLRQDGDSWGGAAGYAVRWRAGAGGDEHRL